ncbi:MAG: hypothetical protein MZV70_33005 [Desulfobacterales bacterium]|nr:hypothetical protein [Desulfobacterales bacterium]
MRHSSETDMSLREMMLLPEKETQRGIPLPQWFAKLPLAFLHYVKHFRRSAGGKKVFDKPRSLSILFSLASMCRCRSPKENEKEEKRSQPSRLLAERKGVRWSGKASAGCVQRRVFSRPAGGPAPPRASESAVDAAFSRRIICSRRAASS